MQVIRWLYINNINIGTFVGFIEWIVYLCAKMNNIKINTDLLCNVNINEVEVFMLLLHF
jgi:hypothetical protein